MSQVRIDVSTLYAGDERAKLSRLDAYVAEAVALAGEGRDVTLTGPGPIWLYLRLAHALHGKAKSLSYDSPVTGPVSIFDHNPH